MKFTDLPIRDLVTHDTQRRASAATHNLAAQPEREALTGAVADRRSLTLAEIQPRPTKGIFVAITVMNWTFASSGRLAM